MMIRCGHCRSLHPTVADVRKCGASEALVPAALRSVNIEDVEREMHRMEAEADRAESERDMVNKAAKWDAEARGDFRRQMTNDEPADLRALLEQVRGMLTTRVIPSGEMRWVEAMRRLISGQGNTRVTEFALRTAIAKLNSWEAIRPGHTPDEGRWSSADRERAQTARSADKPVEREGLYRLSRIVAIEGVTYAKGTYFQVVRNQEATHLYAKMVTFLPPVDGKNVRPRLDYVRGMVFQLRDEELLPVEEAEEITRKTGWCIFGHFLTNPKSIARGMGPKCFERYPHLARNAEEAA